MGLSNATWVKMLFSLWAPCFDQHWNTAADIVIPFYSWLAEDSLTYFDDSLAFPVMSPESWHLTNDTLKLNLIWTFMFGSGWYVKTLVIAWLFLCWHQRVTDSICPIFWLMTNLTCSSSPLSIHPRHKTSCSFGEWLKQMLAW